jgi:hypothetical protein
MTGRHPFKEPTKKFSHQRRARGTTRVSELKTEIAGSLEIGDPNKAIPAKPRRSKIQ